MSLKTAWLNLQDSLGNRFAWSHVNAVYYNWDQKKLLKEKLDDIDTAINAKVAKTDIVQVESTSQSTVPSSAYLKSVKDALDAEVSQLTNGLALRDSSKLISLEEITHSYSDLEGFIDANTAASLHLQSSYYSAWSHSNSGNNAQLFMSLEYPGVLYGRVARGDGTPPWVFKIQTETVNSES